MSDTHDASVPGGTTVAATAVAVDTTPMTDHQDEPTVGSETTCFHFVARTNLGWMTWREREASLYALFERGFSASKVTLKIGASLTDFGVEVEVPNDQATKFEKYFKGQALPMEIDKMHGLHPVNKTRDVKLFGLKKSLGSTVPYTNRRSSLENLQERLASLESCGQTRDREVLAMQEQLNFLLNEVTKRTQGIEARVEERIADKVERRMAMMEKTIRDTALACIGV